MPANLKPFGLVLVLGVVGSLLGVAVACSTSSTADTITPITGIVLRAETLTTGKGCGAGPTQVFKYAAVLLRQGTGQVVSGNLYDCFSDGHFVFDSLPATSTYDLQVFVYNEAAFGAAGGRVALGPIATDPNALRKTTPTWTTTCTATVFQDVETLAVCRPIASGTGGLPGANPGESEAAIQLETRLFATAGGGQTSCATSSDGGAPEAGSEDGGGDAEAGVAEAGALRPSFEKVRVRWRVGSQVGPSVDLSCPETFVLRPATPAPAVFTLDVGLVGAGGARLGETTCTATAIPGVTTSAVCLPVP